MGSPNRTEKERVVNCMSMVFAYDPSRWKLPWMLLQTYKTKTYVAREKPPLTSPATKANGGKN